MSKNNNIEDFFNKALDGFNQEPNGQVWEDLKERLDTPPPFWRMPLFWGLTVAGLLVTSGILGSFAFSKINTLSNQKKELAAQNLYLKNELSNCSNSIEKTEAGFHSETKKHNTEVSRFETDFKKFEEKLTARNNQIAELKNQIFHFENELDSLENQISVTLNADSPVTSAFDKKKKRILRNKPENLISGFEITSNKIKKNHQEYFRNLKSKTTITYGTPYEIPRIPAFEPSMKFGATGGAFTTFTDLNSTQKLGWNAGVTLQIQVLKNIGLTGEIRYNFNEYGVSLDTDNQSVTTSFPHARQINRNIRIVNVANYFFDLPVGLKFNKKIPKTGGSFYINPGVAWQFYLPQRFGYDTDSDYILLREDRYFAYFGSAFLNLGFEKKINKNLTSQIGLWGEKGLIKYGIEGRNMTHLGIRGTILFGK